MGSWRNKVLAKQPGRPEKTWRRKWKSRKEHPKMLLDSGYIISSAVPAIADAFSFALYAYISPSLTLPFFSLSLFFSRSFSSLAPTSTPSLSCSCSRLLSLRPALALA